MKGCSRSVSLNRCSFGFLVRLVMRLASQLHCPWSETGPIPVRGAGSLNAKRFWSANPNSARFAGTSRRRSFLESRTSTVLRPGIPQLDVMDVRC
jgi:hypothetical protein